MKETKVFFDKESLLASDQSEKRLFKRIDVGLEVELMVDGSALHATTANISCGGLFLMLDAKELKEVQDLSLVIHLPNRQKPVQVVAEVLRKENDSREGVAVKFQGLYNDNILAIEQFIKSNLH